MGPNHLLCIGFPEIGRGPLNLLIDRPAGSSFPSLGLVKGAPLLVREHTLRVGPLRVLLDGAETWRPPLSPHKGVVAREVWEARARRLLRVIDPWGSPPGLGGLAVLPWKEDARFSLLPLAARALPFARRIAAGLRAKQPPLLEEGIRGLIGLGPGLTPSGDDFLGGWMTLLRSTEGGHGFPSQALDAVADAIRRISRGRTPLISEGLLRCAVEGASSEGVHHLLAALQSGDGEESGGLAAAVQNVIMSGHSSGWDTLAGMSWGLRSLLESIPPQGPPSGPKAVH